MEELVILSIAIALLILLSMYIYCRFWGLEPNEPNLELLLEPQEEVIPMEELACDWERRMERLESRSS